MIGPNCAGIISPGKAMLGIMPGHIYTPGNVGIVSRSGTLGYEAAQQLKAWGIGVTTSVGIGGDPINGSSFLDLLQAVRGRPGDRGRDHDRRDRRHRRRRRRAAWINATMTKPVVAYVAGLTAPKGRTMGHAGAIISAPSARAPRRRSRS